MIPNDIKIQINHLKSVINYQEECLQHLLYVINEQDKSLQELKKITQIYNEVENDNTLDNVIIDSNL